ncbi:MAG: hypothetical protein PHW29_01045 [Flavobacterium sp.]|nr:hypothetical protein [Flavobacterium sp.]
MEQKQIEVIKSTIKTKIDRGDFVTLSKILEVPQITARARYRRDNEDTVLIMRKIIEEKQKLITKVKKYASNLCNAQ